MGEPLLTERSFCAIASSLRGARESTAGGYTVEHRWRHADGDTEVHHQRFDSNGELRLWKPGEATPDLRIVGEAPTKNDLAHGRIHRPDACYVLEDGVERDLLGLPLAPWVYQEFDLGELRCIGRIACGAGPDGYFQRRLACEGARISSHDASADVRITASGEVRTITGKGEFRINAPYGALLRWLHTDTLLGHLSRAGFDIGGDIWRLSAVEGLLDATRSDYSSGAEQSAVLARYGAARHHPASRAALESCRTVLN